MISDLRFAVRTLLRQPTFTAVVIGSLAIGIGGSAAIFSVFNTVLLRDLPYPDAGQLYLMRSVTPDGSATGSITPREIKPFSEDPNHPIVEAIAFGWSQDVQVVDAEGITRPTRRYGVTEDFFDVFAPRMELGDGFDAEASGAPIVITYQLWRDFFASDPDIVGRSIDAEGYPHRVVGVTPESFTFPEDPGYWSLMRLGPSYDLARVYRGFVRLRSGRTHEQFQAALDRVSVELGPDPRMSQQVQLVAQPFLEYVVGDMRSTVTILLAATGLLLLIACLNVANLMLARMTVSGREVALREALGSGRWRTLRRLLTESLLLAFGGGVLGLTLAAGGVRALLRFAPADLPRLESVPIDAAVLTFALLVTVATGALISVAPAWRLTRSELRDIMNESGRGARGGRGRSRAFGGFVVAEIAFAVMLVIGAALLARTYANLTSTDPGFNPDGLLTFFMNVPGYTDVKYEGQDADGEYLFSGTYYQPLAGFFRDLKERIEGLSGVEAVATANSVPLSPEQYDLSRIFNLPDQPGMDTPEGVSVGWTRSVGPDFFTTMQTRLLRGRGIEATDRHDTPGVAVVNEAFARRHFPGQDPLGQHIRYPDNPYAPGRNGFQFAQRTVDELEVVGVVDDVKYDALAEPAEPTIFMSTEQWISRRRTVVVRTSAIEPQSLVEPIRREIAAMDPSLTAEFALMTSIVDASIARQRLGMALLMVLGLVALLLAAVGVYGLMSHFVAQRRSELAVRAAVGASAAGVVGLVMRRGISLALTGVVLGVVGASALRRIIESQLYGISSIDPAVFTLVPATLLVVGSVACLVPSWRAAKIDPAELLRVE